MSLEKRSAEVIVLGGGLAGLSAAVYLGRARRDTLVIDSGKSMARWEPDVQNYLGFPDGISGVELLKCSRAQARRYHARFFRDEIVRASRTSHGFQLKGRKGSFKCHTLLLATGIFHIPPDIPGIRPCLGHSMFFCKDCDGYRVQGKDIAIYGWSNETVKYALGMMLYSPCVTIVTDGRAPRWDAKHARWIRDYKVPLYLGEITGAHRRGTHLKSLEFEGGDCLVIDALFTTRGDIYRNDIAAQLGAKINAKGEIVVSLDMHTSVHGLYAAGCVTPVNCQMIIAAGEGATAAQAINSDLLQECLASHSLRRFRGRQLLRDKTRPAVQATSRGKRTS
jgi:thioredoxin reductase (NADPH)